MAIDIPLMYLYRLLFSIFFFIIILFYWIYTEYAAVDRLSWNSNWLLTPPPPPPKKNCSFHNFPLFPLYVSLKLARISDWTWLLWWVVFLFLAALSKVFWKLSLSLLKGQDLRLVKSTSCPNILSYFVSFGCTTERLITGSRIFRH